MNTDDVMKLMPTIGHETQAKIRKALDQLVVSAREGAFCEAADAIGGLYSTKPQGLERATTNTGDSASSGSASGRTPELNAESPAPSASVCEVCDDPDPMFRLGGVLRCSECHQEHHDKMRACAPNSVTLPILDVNRLYGADAPASEIPAWVPSALEIGNVAGTANISRSWYRHGDECYEAVRRLIAERAEKATMLLPACLECGWEGDVVYDKGAARAAALAHADVCSASAPRP